MASRAYKTSSQTAFARISRGVVYPIITSETRECNFIASSDRVLSTGRVCSSPRDSPRVSAFVINVKTLLDDNKLEGESQKVRTSGLFGDNSQRLENLLF
jgi:hypothetical protein